MNSLDNSKLDKNSITNSTSVTTEGISCIDAIQLNKSINGSICNAIQGNTDAINLDHLNNSCKQYSITENKAGWYRFAEYTNDSVNGVDGSSTNSCGIIIKKSYVYSEPEYYVIELMALYQKSEFALVRKAYQNGQYITKIRHTILVDRTITFLEFYMRAPQPILALTINLEHARSRGTGWILYDSPILIPETDELFNVRSSLDLTI